jgi:hypothetical protein
MQYQVPQFIEIEDKIFGPLTFKQFLYVAGGGAISFLAWSFLPRFFAIIIGGPILAFFLMSAFFKVNGRPFLFYVESVVKFFFSKKLYLWKKEKKQPVMGDRSMAKESRLELPKLSESKLRELSWGLDVHERTVSPTQRPMR